MKIIKEQFDSFAQEQGYSSGAELIDELGLNPKAYKRYHSEVPIGRKVLELLCREIGTAETIDFIRFAPGETDRYREILEKF